LRGNWAYEVRALADLGHRVAVVPSFPDAGRRCHHGVVYIDDVPVLDSPFGQDPLTAPVSNRPMDVIEEAGCVHANVVVWDANDNMALAAAISRCRDENRILVGPTGAIGAYAATVFPDRIPLQVKIPRPVLIVCGSLNATSRHQIARLGLPVLGLEDDLSETNGLMLIATHYQRGAIDNDLADSVASGVAARVRDLLKSTRRIATLLVIGGDTSAAIVGDATLDVIGTVDTGIPISRFSTESGEVLLITKGGGIGQADTLTRLLGQ
jgi:uncharacterized protein YgbK (DUF1537 family)